jgi:hypothetical protein
MANIIVYQSNAKDANELRNFVLDKINEIVQQWMDQGKYGCIQINFAAGGITNLNLSESVKLEEQK